MRICGHVGCLSAHKSDGAMKKNQITLKIAFFDRNFTLRVPKSHKSEWVKDGDFFLLFDAAHKIVFLVKGVVDLILEYKCTIGIVASILGRVKNQNCPKTFQDS